MSNFVSKLPEFSLISNVLKNTDGYENKIIYILNHRVKGLCLSINLVPSFVF